MKRYSEFASEHASTLQVKMKTYYDKNSRQRSLAAGQQVLALLSDNNNSLLCNWKGRYTVLRKVNNTNYEIDLGYRVTCLYINLLRSWNEGLTESAHEPEPAANIVLVEEDGDVEQFELSLIFDVERDSDEFIIGERLTVQQRGQLLDLFEEYKDRFAKRVGRTDIVSHKIRLKEDVPYTRRMYAIPDSLQDEVDRQVAELLEQGMIEESDGPYAAPIVCVKKQNGEIKLTCDYRSITCMTVDNLSIRFIKTMTFAQLYSSK